MRASRKAGLPVPWGYIRATLAARWHVPPWQVDEAPVGEIREALLIMRLEGEAEAERERRRPSTPAR